MHCHHAQMHRMHSKNWDMLGQEKQCRAGREVPQRSGNRCNLQERSFVRGASIEKIAGIPLDSSRIPSGHIILSMTSDKDDMEMTLRSDDAKTQDVNRRLDNAIIIRHRCEHFVVLHCSPEQPRCTAGEPTLHPRRLLGGSEWQGQANLSF